MTTPTPTSKAELTEFFRQACTSAMLGRALSLRSDEWNFLSPLELRAAEQMVSVLARMPEGWLSASLLATRARVIFAEAGWPELSLLGRCLELYPTIKLHQGQSLHRRQDAGDSLAKTSDRLQSMLEKEVKEGTRRSSQAHLTAMLMVRRHIEAAQQQMTKESAFRDWNAETDSAGALEGSQDVLSRLEAFHGAARMAEIGEVAEEVESQILDELTERTSAAMRRRDWNTTAELRGRYLLYWNSAPAGRILEPRKEDTLQQLFDSRKMGNVVGTMHSKSIVHGSLLLENFSPDIRIKNFGQTKILDAPDIDDHISRLVEDASRGKQISPEDIAGSIELSRNPKQYGVDNPHIEAFVEDLLPLWHQLSPARRQHFAQGYASAEGYAVADEVLRRVSARVESLAGQTTGLPFVPLHVPHFAIRAAGYSLRHFSPWSTEIELSVQEVDAIEDFEKRLIRLKKLIVETFQIAPKAHAEAVERLVADMWRLKDDPVEATIKTCEEAAHGLRQFVSEAHFRQLAACSFLARANAASSEDQKALLFLQAAAELIAMNEYWSAILAAELLSDALSHAVSPVTFGEVAIKCMSHYVELRSTHQDRAFLELALSVAAQIPPFFLSEEHKDLISAYEQYARAMLADVSDGTRRDKLGRVAALCDRYPSLGELKQKVTLQGLAAIPKDDADQTDDEGVRPSPMAGQYLAQRNWPAAASVLLHQLNELQAANRNPSSCLLIASRFAFALQCSSDYLPAKRPMMARDLLDVVVRYGPVVLAEVNGTHSPPGIRGLLSHANTLGWAAVHFAGFVPGRGDVLVERGIELLEIAVRLSPKEKFPRNFSFYANNLALGYQARARMSNTEEAAPLLKRAVELMKEVAEVDEQLSKSSDPDDIEASATAHIDHLNLGLMCHDLARRTYDATWISKKPQESARWYRQASQSFHRSRVLAESQNRPDNAGTAQNSLALVFTELSELSILERIWAGGDMQRAFYDWVCAVAGGHVSTGNFLNRCAEGALVAAVAAVRAGIRRNPALLLESMDTQLRLWSLFHQYPDFAPAIARHCLVTMLELLDELNDSGGLERYGEAVSGLPELQRILQSLVQVEVCQHVTRHFADAEAAYDGFKSLSKTGSPVSRAIARTWLPWFEIQQGEAHVVVNGLYLGASNEGLELRIPSQRRGLTLSGLAIDRVGFAVCDASRMRESAAMLAARMESAMQLEDLPPALLTGKAIGSIGGAKATIEAIRLPIASWDGWALELSVDAIGSSGLRPSLPYVGRYDLSGGALNTESPAQIDQPGQSLIFGEHGITLEVMIPFGGSLDGAHVTVDGTFESPEIHLQCNSVLLVLKTTPRITSADVVYLVKGDRPEAAACCAASFDLTSPSLSFPAPMLHTFAPLFFFDGELPPTALTTIGELNPHEIVLIGLPDDQAAADAMFEQLFDPRRELLILVEEAERSSAETALAQLHATIDSEIGGNSLLRAAAFRSAAAKSLRYDPFDSIQIVVGHRDWVPPAVQMLLDLAAIRRLSVEDVPFVSEGSVGFVNIKGNPFIQRRDASLFRGIVTMQELSARYCGMTRRAAGDIVARDASAPDQIMKLVAPTVPRRPAFLLPRNSDTAVTAIPYLRHLGALPLPSGDALEFLKSLQPSEIYATAKAAAGIPAGDWAVRIIPEQPLQLTRYFQEQTRTDYQKTLDDLPHAHPHLVAMRPLLEEMKPAEYVVLCTNRETERAWAYLAANYAGALRAPLLLADMSVHSEAKATVDPDLWGPVNLPKTVPATVPTLDKNIDRALRELAPVYVGYVSPNVGRAIELMGSPPLATRFAVGRLSGPDLAATALLITRAALSEDVVRPANIQAVVVDCAEAVPSRPLPGVHREVDAIRLLFDHEADISLQFLDSTSDAHDKSAFLRSLPTAHLVHFAGHGYYDPSRPERSGLQFHEGVMTPGEMVSDAAGAPIVFSNACETGLLNSVASSHGESAWSGLAASFIARGAVNYLGSLSPIFDDSSAQFASRFYRLLVDGKSVGEALLHARMSAYDHNDTVWDTYVLFGCPRNRIHAR